MAGFVTGLPKVLLRAEALFVLVGASAAYAQSGASWKLFALLFLVPDLSMLGYLAGQRIGAIVYNVAHWYSLPLTCIGWGFFGHSPDFLAVGLIWVAHIALDRVIGAGLKYSDGFRFSHLGVFGKAPSASVPIAAQPA